MKYIIGDKVKYDGGDWFFYGTITAIFEHSTSPCYRIDVDRMEKKGCKLSITQFEFELESVADEIDNDLVEKQKVEKPKRISRSKVKEVEMVEKPVEDQVETVPLEKKRMGRPKKVQSEPKPVRRKKTTWAENFEKYKNGDRSNAIKVWAAQNRKEYKTGKMNEEKKDMLIGIRFPLMIVRKKR